MIYFTLFFIELVILFLLSRDISRVLFIFFYKISKNKTFAISALAFIFFPGTLIHELSHALFAVLLRVHVGTMEFNPKVEGDSVKLGSVQIAQTDPIRRFLIGAAPFFLGTVILLSILLYATQNHYFDNTILSVVIGYIVFEIGNTMFSSRKDMEGALELFGSIIFLLLVFYLLGIRLPAFNPNSILSQPVISKMLRYGSLYLLVPLGIDIIVLLLFRPFRKI